jgi:gamma-glutamylcyclotransferase (GGCT)/AIG2-like uncharacterized protein YtfP
LKNGKGNHRLLAHSKFLGRCYIEDNQRLISLGGYPGLVRGPDLDKRRVVGEVYQVNEETLQSLDWLEGHPRYYERQKVPTPFKNAWTYYLPVDYLTRGYPDAGACWQPTADEVRWMNEVDDSP